jgi:hypothetical protein
MGIPTDPANAPVWSEIRDHLDEPGFPGQYVTIADAPRNGFHHHPWSIGGGGAAELKDRLDEAGEQLLGAFIDDVGRTTHTGEDDAFFMPQSTPSTYGLRKWCSPLVIGEDLRDYNLNPNGSALLPYDETAAPLANLPSAILQRLWPARTSLANRSDYSQTILERGLQWYEHSMFFSARFLKPLGIAFAFISTHNQFVIVRTTAIFNRSAPVIKLREACAIAEYVSLVGLLNSSAAGFWFRQVCYPKGGDHVGSEGARVRKTLWEERFEYDAANISRFPMPADNPVDSACAIQAAADERSALLPYALINKKIPDRASLDAARDRAHALLLRMIALQEEIDWHVYQLYGLIDESLTLPLDQVPPVQLGERAFEILMARATEAGDQTEWFKRHRSTPCSEIPDHWPEPYRVLVQRRLDVISADRDIALIEQPEYKRRWNLPPWEELEHDALRAWLLDRLEDPRYWPSNPPALNSVARLADAIHADREFLQVAEVYCGRPDFDVPDLVQELVARESIPFLPVLRYKDSGLRKRADWEHTWELQRHEDAGEKVEIPVPPKYERTDFLADYWRLRGKLDVPKERWISYPGLERDADKSPVIAWAGYDYGQQSLALAGYANEMRINEGWTAERLIPVLAGLKQLQPWLDQWHNEIDPDRQQHLNESIRTFVESEMTQLALTTERIREWRPPARVSATKPRKARARTTTASKSPAPTE